MNKTLKVIRKLAKGLGLDPKKISNYEDRFVVTDTFTTVMASSEENTLSLWPKAHEKFIDFFWENRDVPPKNKYEEVMVAKLSKCLKKPQVDIMQEGEESGVNFIIYTDTTDAFVAEAERFKGLT